MLHKLFALLGGLTLLASSQAFAQPHDLSAIPPGLPKAQHDSLSQRRVQLERRWNALRATVEAHNHRCTNVPADAPIANECRQKMTELQADLDSYRQAEKDFNRVIGESAAGSAAVAPKPSGALGQDARRENSRRELRATIALLEKRIRAEQQAIRNLGLMTTAKTFEAWEEMAEGEKNRLEMAFLDNGISTAISGLKHFITTRGSIDVKSLQTELNALKAANVDPARLRSALIALQNARGHEAIAQAINANIDVLKTTAQIVQFGHQAQSDRNDPVVALRAVGLIAVALTERYAPTPLVKLAIRESKLLVTYAFVEAGRRVIAEDVEKVMHLPEQQLKALALHSRRMQDSVKELQKTKAELALL